MTQIRFKTKEEINRFLNDAFLGLGDTSKLNVPNSLLYLNRELPIAHFLVNYFRQPENFPFLCKWVFNINLLPFQHAIIEELWTHPFPMLLGSRGLGKTFLLALYAMMKAFLYPNHRVVITGAAFRQSKMVFDYCCNIWYNADVLRSIVGSGKGLGPSKEMDKCSVFLGDSSIVLIPLGTGDKIRGLRANTLCLDEFASIPVAIYEVVLKGFGIVSADPYHQVKEIAKQKAMIDLGIDSSSIESVRTKNQTIITGTAYYAFNHFYDYWKRYKAIIQSGGDKNILRDLFGGEVDEHFDYRDYSISRVPYNLLPDGFHDATQVSQNKATSTKSTFLMEYEACFANDSNGFFKRTLIESCVVSPTNIIRFPSGEAMFTATLTGDKNKKYIYGIDPASERDLLCCIILELCDDHSRVVYCWTTNRKKYRSQSKRKAAHEVDFYGFCARKIRDLMKVFPCEHIGIDSQGGIGIIEALHSPSFMEEGELPLWPIINYDKTPTDTDKFAGIHCIEACSFSDAKWLSEANHGLKMDLENKTVLFPYFDSLQSALALEYDSMNKGGDITQVLDDSLETVMLEIEELKNELSTIVLTRTGTSEREHWDTPDKKIAGQKSGRALKDRYSALLISNMIARNKLRPQAALKNTGFRGGAAHEMAGGKPGNQMYTGPDWYVKNATKDICIGIRNGERFN